MNFLNVCKRLIFKDFTIAKFLLFCLESEQKKQRYLFYRTKKLLQHFSQNIDDLNI